jgi:hypothetical protein
MPPRRSNSAHLHRLERADFHCAPTSVSATEALKPAGQSTGRPAAMPAPKPGGFDHAGHRPAAFNPYAIDAKNMRYWGTMMFIRQLTAGFLLSLTLLSLPEATLTANAAGPSFVYCKEDIARLCPGVAPGGGRIIGCLKQHKDEVSIGCGKELKGIKAKIGK